MNQPRTCRAATESVELKVRCSLDPSGSLNATLQPPADGSGGNRAAAAACTASTSTAAGAGASAAGGAAGAFAAGCCLDPAAAAASCSSFWRFSISCQIACSSTSPKLSCLPLGPAPPPCRQQET